jgi:photosystem II stability/assembly factor-like uncharacterized protein
MQSTAIQRIEDDNLSLPKTLKNLPVKPGSHLLKNLKKSTNASIEAQVRTVSSIIWDDQLINDDVGAGGNHLNATCAIASSGNYTIAWEDYRTGNSDIYLQRYNLSGTAQGVNVKVNDDALAANHYHPSIATNSTGNTVVAWYDDRNYDIYLRRFDASGNAQGSNIRVNNDDVGTTYHFQPSVAIDGSGNSVVVWYDYRNGNRDIYLQRFNASGIAQGTNVKVNDDAGTSDQYQPSVGVDNSGNCYVAWRDNRNVNYDIYLQCYDASGTAQGSNIKINDDTGAASQVAPTVAINSSGNGVVAWHDLRNGNRDIYIQLFGGGYVPRGVNIKVNDDAGTADQLCPSVGIDDFNNSTVVWMDNRNGDYNIYKQRFGQSGVPYGANVVVNDDGVSAYQAYPCITVNNNGYSVVAWEDTRSGDDIYAQRYQGDNTQGINQKVNDDVGTASQWAPSVGVDGSGNSMIVWEDQRNGDYDIYLQSFNSSGTPQGTNFKVNDDAVSAYQYFPSVAVNSSGNAVVVWEDSRDGYNDIYLQRLYTNGIAVGGNVKVNDATTSASPFNNTVSVAINSSGNYVVAWEDNRNGDIDIYLQRYDANGTVLGSNIKVNDDVGTANQQQPSVAVDGSGNYIVVWYDYRNGNNDIYLQRYSTSGVALGTNIKVNDDNGTNDQVSPVVAVTSTGNFTVAWEDYRNDVNNILSDIYIQRFDASGSPLGGNIMVNDDVGNSFQYWPSIVFDGTGNCLVAWQDYRNGTPDILGQWYTSNGSANQGNFQIVQDGPNHGEFVPRLAASGQTIVCTWQDNRRAKGYDIYAKSYSSGLIPTSTETEPNNTASTANSIAYDGLMDGTIDPDNDVDYFQFSASAGDTVEIIAQNGSGSTIDGNLTVYNSTGIQIAYNDDFQYDGNSGNNSRVVCAIPAAGTYYIRCAYVGTIGSFPDSKISGRQLDNEVIPSKKLASIANTTWTYTLSLKKYQASAPSIASYGPSGYITRIFSTKLKPWGTVYANGSATDVYVDYGTSPAFGSSAFIGNYSGLNGVLFEAVLDGLTASTKYYFQFRASNSFGTTYSDIQSFTTLQPADVWKVIRDEGIAGKNIWTIIARNKDTLFAVTTGGKVLRSFDGGVSINEIVVDTNIILRGIAVLNPTTLVIVGNSNIIMRSTDVGSTWQSISCPVTSNLRSVSFADQNNGMAVGSSGKIILTTNGGLTWVERSSGITNSLYQVTMLNATTVVAVGAGTILRTSDGGSTWTNVGSSYGTNYLLSVSFGDVSHGIIVGDTTLYTANGGITWIPGTAPPRGYFYLWGAAMINAQNGWAVGEGGTIIRTDDGGMTWTQSPSGVSDLLLCVTAVDTNLIFASGQYGLILERNTWQGVDVPTITSFSPLSGSIGTTVTITGTNFNSTPSNNIVYFGTVKATITSATSTSLSVTVPNGATYQPITVTTHGLTAYSQKPFLVTYTGGGVINIKSFAQKVDFPAGMTPSGINVGDMDGDGKPDILVANGDNNISILRNIGTNNNISFASKVGFNVGADISCIALGDLDGDGKLDIVVNHGDSTISVLRNLSTSGNLNFTAKADYTVGKGPTHIAIGDIDGDGKPDVAVATVNSTNFFSIFRNISSVGTIRFSPRIDIQTAQNPFDIKIADIDGDTKPDVVVTHISVNNVSVFRNISTSGNISLASRDGIASLGGPRCVTVVDIDGDGRLDLAVTNSDSNSISAIRNISVSGSISLISSKYFRTGQWPLNISVGDIDGDGKPDIATVNQHENNISVFKNISTSVSISLASKVDFSTGDYPFDAVILDINEDSRPDLIVSNHNDNSISVLQGTPSDNTPPTITHTPTTVEVTVSNGIASQSVDIYASATDAESSVKLIQLQYKRAGEKSDNKRDFSVTDGTQAVQIPAAAFVSTNNKAIGVDYRIAAWDSVDNAAYTSWYSISVRVGDIEQPPTSPPPANQYASTDSLWKAYRIFSIPYDLDDKKPSSFMESSLGSHKKDGVSYANWRMQRITNGKKEDYEEFKYDQVVKPGTGFFLIVLEAGNTIKVSSMTIVNSDYMYNTGVVLSGGINEWYLLGTPLNVTIPWDSLEFVGGTPLDHAYFSGAGAISGWEKNTSNTDTLRPWEGLAVKTSASPCTVKFRTSISTLPKQGAISQIAKDEAKEISPSQNDWQVNVNAYRSDINMRCEGGGFGMRKGANIDHDQFDTYEPPTVGDKTVTFGFSGPNGPRLRDIRPIGANGGVWEMRLTTIDAGARVKLNFDGVFSLPNPSFEIYLLDLGQKIAYNLKTKSTLEVGSGDGTKDFRIVVGKKEYVEENGNGISLGPKEARLFANYPNPFNPETVIRYTIPDKASTYIVTLKIFNILGQELATLVNSEQAPGYYEVKWDARTQSSGVYFYQITITDGNQTFRDIKRMLLIK